MWLHHRKRATHYKYYAEMGIGFKVDANKSWSTDDMCTKVIIISIQEKIEVLLHVRQIYIS